MSEISTRTVQYHEIKLTKEQVAYIVEQEARDRLKSSAGNHLDPAIPATVIMNPDFSANILIAQRSTERG